jgi:hypothetical protein
MDNEGSDAVIVIGCSLRTETILQRRCSQFVLFNKYYYNNEFNEDKIGGANRGDAKCRPNRIDKFSGEITLETEAYISIIIKKQTHTVACSPQANYTDRATAACQRR